METTALQSSKGKSPVLKWLLILGGITGTGLLIKKLFFSGDDIEMPSGDEILQIDEPQNQEQYGINIYKYVVLVSKTWAMTAIKESKRLGKTFEQYLDDYAVAKYVKDGTPTEGDLFNNFENQIKVTSIKVERSSSMVKLIQQKAKEKGVSYQQQLRSDVMWIILDKLIKQRKSEYNKIPGNSNLDQQSNSDAQHGIKGLSGHSL
jgi:predicted DNA binding CopG/RHH family protein